MKTVNNLINHVHVGFFSVIGALAISISVPLTAASNECFPALDNNKPQYIVGYGDLIYQDANKITSIAFRSELPVKVNGFGRGWQMRTRLDNNIKVTRLGVTSQAGDYFNGVLIAMPANGIKSLDRQHKLTCRVEVKPAQLSSLTNNKIPESGQFWLYQTQHRHVFKPAGSYPILMSDVDEFLTGCIAQGDKFGLPSFAQDCISTTSNWSSHWVNDRARPTKVKPAQIKLQRVDKLLEGLEGNLYEQVRSQ